MNARKIISEIIPLKKGGGLPFWERNNPTEKGGGAAFLGAK